MSQTTIRTEIKNVLEGITDIGIVHDYERFTSDWKTLLDLYRDDAKCQIRAWTIALDSATEEINTMQETDRDYTYKIRGYMSLKDSDATAKTFDDLIEAVSDAFRALIPNCLNGKADFLNPIQVTLIDYRMLGSVLCHHCEMTMVVQEGKNV